jgi:hypothetical protein
LGDSAIINCYQIILELNPKTSWVKKALATDELLVHEQGHFNIGILSMKEILFKYRTTKFTKSNFNEVLKNLFLDTQKKYNDLGIKYDNETDHSKNKEQQLKWNKFFETEFTKYK